MSGRAEAGKGRGSVHLNVVPGAQAGPAAREIDTVRPARRRGREIALRLDAIQPNPDNPRRVFDERALDALAESIKCWGQLQPIVVRQVGDTYQLVCGERRWRAHMRAGLETIWAVELDATKEDSLALALVENLQRVDLSHVEKLAALDQLAEITQARGLRKTAGQLGVDPSWLSRQLSVRKDPIIYPGLKAGEIGFGQAAELLRAPGSARRALLMQVIQSPMPVRTATIRRWVEKAREEAHAEEGGPSAYRSLVDRLDQLGPPMLESDRAILMELAQRIHGLLGINRPVESAAVEKTPTKRTWMELSCLLCGEEVGAIVDGRELRPRYANSVRRSDNQFLCGRCGGKLTAGAQREQYFYTF
jgi:ParB family chromosome partitioning protein